MRTLKYEFTTSIQFSEDVYEHNFVLRCQPHRRPGLRVVSGDLRVEPDIHCSRQRDCFGNSLAVGRAGAAHRFISYESFGVVQILDEEEQAKQQFSGFRNVCSPANPYLPHPIYRYPTSLTQPSRAIEEFAFREGEWLLAQLENQRRDPSEEGRQSLEKGIEWLASAVFHHMEYAPGSTRVSTTAAQAFEAKAGVCQDYSHILASALRVLGIPARYVSGLALGEGETHAWVEAFYAGAWHAFDPTRNVPVDTGYLPLAVGRDYQDCPIEQGSFVGWASQVQSVHMAVSELANKGAWELA